MINNIYLAKIFGGVSTPSLRAASLRAFAIV